METNAIKLWSGATSLFDVHRWTFDVRRCSFGTSQYGINAACEQIQNKLALMGFTPAIAMQTIFVRHESAEGLGKHDNFPY
jgi:hypothetical protein